jgi:hypothetical protein
MRLSSAALLLALAGCVVVARPYPRHPPPPPPAAPPPPPGPQAPAPAPSAGISEQQAVQIATDYARSRGARVDRVREVHQDGRGRYHVTLSGEHGRDRARVLVDGATGQVLRAKIKDSDRYDED